MNIQPSFESLVVYLDGQPILVASSLTDCAEMERFLLHTSACAFSSRGRAHSKCIKLRMYWNALRCGMYRMQLKENAHECIT